MKINANLSTESGWEICEHNFIADHLIATGSNFLIGNGYLGYRGTFPEWRKDQYVGCFVSDTYDNADGKWTELCNVPNALYTLIKVDGEAVTTSESLTYENVHKEHSYCRKLDLKQGLMSIRNCWTSKTGKRLMLKTEQFASYSDLHLIPQRLELEMDRSCVLEIITGIDALVWDLNGRHLFDHFFSSGPNHLAVEVKTGELGTRIIVMEGLSIDGKKPFKQTIIEAANQEGIFRKLAWEIEAGEKLVLEKSMVVYSSNDLADPGVAANRSLKKALKKGYVQLKADHTPFWEEIWFKTDMVIEGDLKAQTVLRFNHYHNFIATPFHSDCLPIGARGLSCQAYQGSAFWDQEIFNLPVYYYTKPEIARNILTYRYKTLDGARQKARELGYEGAFYAWVSGKSGRELCPSFFFTDVLSGRNIRNHFNDWQMHISPDIVYAIWNYYLATGDWDFIEEYGAEIILEVARFLYSFAYFKKDKNRYELIRLLGPDEYHENIDNNAFTNYQTRFSLHTALIVYDRLKEINPGYLTELFKRLNLSEEDYRQWEEMARLIYLPQPDPENGLIEQFRGYYDLEDVLPFRLEERLIDKSEYWGWPNGVAVHTRVTKQADVLQLLCLQDIFPPDIVKRNYDFYEPYCQHGSSLSPAVHAIVAAKAGYIEQAYEYFMRSCMIDLAGTNKAFSGGTFIGGIHTASCGAAWQVIAFGFAGIRISEEGIGLNPVLPGHWHEVRFKVFYRGQELFLTISQASFSISASSENSAPVQINAYGHNAVLQPGVMLIFKEPLA